MSTFAYSSLFAIWYVWYIAIPPWKWVLRISHVIMLEIVEYNIDSSLTDIFYILIIKCRNRLRSWLPIYDRPSPILWGVSFQMWTSNQVCSSSILYFHSFPDWCKVIHSFNIFPIYFPFCFLACHADFFTSVTNWVIPLFFSDIVSPFPYFFLVKPFCLYKN